MGEIVARGAIKVDARKARDKLRDHLLPDLHLYATEIARAAIALGASRLDLDYDADDAIFTFDRSLPLELLVSIRDHVLAPAGEDAPRLLGIAVNAALGLRPSFVDLIRAEGGRCMRVRFRGDDDPVTSEVKPSRGMIPDGLRVHFRRAPGLETLGRLVNRELLPEVALLIATTHDAPIAVMHEGKSVGRPQSRAVLRLDIDEPALKRTFIEISGPGPRAQTDFLEHGVRLVTHETVFGAWVHRRMPIRLVVDAKRLPTNASRSELRVDAELLQRLAQKTPVALERALAEIVARREEPAVEEALGAIAAQVVLLIRQGTKVPAPLRELLDLPLMRDAIGRPLAPRSLPQNAFFVYRGEEALPGSLAPWLAGVPWDRGRAIDACFAEIPHRPADNVVALALAAHERRARALSHPASPPALGVGTYSIRHAFDIALGPFAGLKGEVALAPRGTLALARFFVESRLIETRPLPGVTLPLAIALEWPNRIRPKFTYDGVEMDATVTQAIVFALRSAALLIARETKDLDLARLAIVAAHSASHDLGDKNLGALTEVDALPVWPITTGRLVSTATLAAYAAKKGAICAGPSGSGPAVDDRPVVENAWVADVCRMFGGIPSIPYGRFLPPQQGGMNAEAAHHRIVVWFDRDGAHGFVAPGRGKMLFHAGQFIGRLPLERPFLVVVDDRHAVPGVGAHVPWTSPLDLAKEEHELVARVLDRCEREENPQLAEWLAELPQMDEVLRNRIVALPRRMALRKKNEARDALLARPIDIPKVVPTAQPHARVQRAGNRAILALAPSTWTEGRVEIFFRDHSIGVAEVKRWKVIVRADLADETLFDDSFAALEAVGNSTVAALVDDGVVGLAKVLVALESFPFDEAAIGFVRKVVEVSRRDIRDAVGSASWPTVQGGRTKLHEGPNSYGRERYATYRMADETSPYDAPALLLSEPATRLLKVLGFELTDVTEPIARLQTRRSRGLASRPRLEGPASAFRRTLEELGATTCDGEIELVPEPSQTEVRHVDERGISRLMDMSVPFPLRAVFRGDSEEDVRNAAHALAFAIPMHDAVPFVLTAKRIAMCQKGIQEAHLDMEVWPDNTGAFRSIRSMMSKTALEFTRINRPHKVVALVLETELEIKALGKVQKLRDGTKRFEAAVEGERRRNGPQVTQLEIAPDIRPRCLGMWKIDRDGIVGEVGILAPSAASYRGIAIHTTRRLVQLHEDGTGWPLIASVDMRLATNQAFDRILHHNDGLKIQRTLRVFVGEQALFRPPAKAMGSIFVMDEEFFALLVIDAAWPEHPTVEVHGDGFVLPDHIPRSEKGVVPVRGRVYTTGTPPGLPRLFDRIASKIARHLDDKMPAEERAAYEWDLAILGVFPDRDPRAELARDRPDPILVKVATRRAPHLLAESAPLSTPPPPPPKVVADQRPPAERGEIVTALRDALDRLHLTGDPVMRVAETDRGRAVRYEHRTVWVNVTHSAVKRLATASARDIFLLAAAVSEINRELVPVTDAEERAVLMELLR